MKRVMVLGVAAFFALMTIAMVSVEQTAVAGHGCNGCSGKKCGGRSKCDCGGRRRRAKKCCGTVECCVTTCAPACAPACAAPACSSCAGGAVHGEVIVEGHGEVVHEAAPVEAAPAASEAPPAPAEPSPAAAAPAADSTYYAPVIYYYTSY